MATTPPAPQQPYALTPPSAGYAQDLVVRQHQEALYAFGEWSMFVLLWTITDFTAGLVGRCLTCYETSRFADAYGQGARTACPDCLGTTFEGGYRAKIVRPAIWNDGQSSIERTRRGMVRTDDLAVESAADFVMHPGDYLFRQNGLRYQVTSIPSQAFLRTGFAAPGAPDGVALNIASARREEDTSVAYLVPPEPAVLMALLTPSGTPLPDWSATEVIRASLTSP